MALCSRSRHRWCLLSPPRVCSVTPRRSFWRSRQHLSALSHGTRHQVLRHITIPTFPGFALCSAALQEDLWGFQVPLSDAPKARGCSGGQQPHLEQETEPGVVQRQCSASHTAQEILSLETAAGPSQEAQDGGDRRPDADAAALQLQLEISSSIFTDFTRFITFLFC